MSRAPRLIRELYETILIISGYMSVSARGFYDTENSATAAELNGDDSKDSSDILPYTMKNVKGSSEEDKNKR